MINQQEIKDNGSLGKPAMEGQENGFSRHTIGSGTPGEDFTAPGLATQQVNTALQFSFFSDIAS